MVKNLRYITEIVLKKTFFPWLKSLGNSNQAAYLSQKEVAQT